ncbi:hypothetical protein [Desulforegula conservatrix]|uniref:hypothetical protein n=1 Tax=Desulforegula conservatrix TaxID=153026 RepID=UPI0012ECAB71|nr:hypothetical protein [Desulforegula conservatrix]
MTIKPESRNSLKNTKNSEIKRSNGELSCAAAALLVKSVRVGVSLGDLLAMRLKKQRQTIKQFRAINDLKLPYQNIKTENSKTQMSYQEWLPLLKLEKFRTAKLPKP